VHRNLNIQPNPQVLVAENNGLPKPCRNDPVYSAVISLNRSNALTEQMTGFSCYAAMGRNRAGTISNLLPPFLKTIMS